MATLNKFNFGDLSFKLKFPQLFAGMQWGKWGEAIIAGGYFKEDLDNYTYGFGEIVEVIGQVGVNYVVKPYDATTAATALLAVIMNETTGAETIYDGTINKGAKQVPLNLWILDKTHQNLGDIIVPLVEGTTTKAVLGGQVYVGTGTDGTIQGSAYSENVAGTKIVTGLTFKSEVSQPTAAKGLSIAVGFKLGL